ncbi:MAG: hypothetical protein HeimC2_07250 [Candidatus Heimdallarchaeota archaeon LC_2]|nr:MAG: hypothetical protein HeimC2_07250 [Candidatus Heimdallarchaeota archaeon LC_2]
MNEPLTKRSFIELIKWKISSLGKEWYGMNFLLFTSGRLITSMTILFYASIFSFFYNNELINTTNAISSDIHFDMLKEYLIGLKVASIIITSYFLTFHWSHIHRNGEYGYWISLGVKREKFYITTALFFISILFLNVIFSFIVLRTIGGLKFAFLDDLMILSIIFASMILMIGIAWVVGELVKKPELSSAIFLIFYGLNFQFNLNEENLLSDILFGESHIKNSNLLIHFLSPLVIGLVMIYLGYYLNKMREIEI